MDNNRYNLRSSSGRQQVAPSLRPASSTTVGTSEFTNTAAASTAEATGLSSSLLPGSNASQAALQAGRHPHQFPQQPQPQPHPPRDEQQQHQQFFPAAQAGSGPSTEIMAEQQPYYYQQQQQQTQGISMGGPAATAPFLQDFTLVAEAVKRVQMDAVMTEMESITL